MQIPTTKKLSDMERFCVGLRLLASECNMTEIDFNAFGPTKFYFKDGSWVGSLKAAMEAGLIDEELWNKQYGYK